MPLSSSSVTEGRVRFWQTILCGAFSSQAKCPTAFTPLKLQKFCCTHNRYRRYLSLHLDLTVLLFAATCPVCLMAL